MANGYSFHARAGDAAEIFIYDDIGEEFNGITAKQFTADLKSLGRVSKIDVRINSFGGSVWDGLAIYRQLVDHPAKITVHIDGVAASIASVIAMSGSDIYIAEAGRVMIHNASGVVKGGSSTLRRLADIMDQMTASLADVYVARTKQTVETIKSWMEVESWFGAPKALELGFVTAIAPNMRVAAKLDSSNYDFINMPADLLAAPVSASPPIGRPALDAAAARIHRMKAVLTLRA